MRNTRGCLVLGVVFLFTSSAFCEVAPVVVGTYPAPVAETRAVVMRWLHESGSAAVQESADVGNVRLKVHHNGETIRIDVRPQSPLGSIVEVASDSNMPATIKGLKSSLDAYFHGFTREREDAPRSIPAKVEAQANAVVCLKAVTKGEAVQLTGFVIDRRGEIVATAHDLDTILSIRTDGNEGVELKGEIARRDVLRDLSIIRVKNTFKAAVAVKAGRRKLKTGDMVYSIGCSQNLSGRVRVGIVDGPPALVNGQLLWQVNMEVVPGSSGSPVFDTDGRLVGVVKGRYRGTDSRGFLIPLDTIKEFLGQGKR